MNFKISQRKAFLTEQKNKGQRITIGFTGIADLRSFIALEYIVATAVISATESIIPIIVTIVLFLFNFKFLIVNLLSKSILFIPPQQFFHLQF